MTSLYRFTGGFIPALKKNAADADVLQGGG
jgi:hypothetical protein